jgi:hypothetical protein
LVGFGMFVAAAAACANDVKFIGSSGAGGASTSTTTSTGTGTSTSGSGGSGDCSSDAQCNGGTCAPIVPGGWKICVNVPPEATKCQMMGGQPDQCCTSKDCKPPAACYDQTTLPQCGGVFAATNTCIADACQSDADCIHNNPEPWICIPAGAWGYPKRQCFTAYCRTNADCTAKTGGTCRPIANPCCNRPMGMACVYPGGCVRDPDCGDDAHCEIDPATKSTACKPGLIGCPA